MFPTKGSDLKLDLFCSLQSNCRAKFIPLQPPRTELITCEIHKKISNSIFRAGTAGSRAANKEC